MQDKTKILAEKYLGGVIPQTLYELEKETATAKLGRIIARYGDEDGERRQPHYLARLIAESIESDLITFRYVNFGVKKGSARINADNSDSKILEHPHYNTEMLGMSRENIKKVVGG